MYAVTKLLSKLPGDFEVAAGHNSVDSIRSASPFLAVGTVAEGCMMLGDAARGKMLAFNKEYEELPVTAGSPVYSYFTSPHKHDPFVVIVKFTSAKFSVP